jgi:hypothetical protein
MICKYRNTRPLGKYALSAGDLDKLEREGRRLARSRDGYVVSCGQLQPVLVLV